jgi:hypothetical protein
MNTNPNPHGAKSLEELAAEVEVQELTDDEMVDAIVEAFTIPRGEAIDRLAALNIDVLRGRL